MYFILPIPSTLSDVRMSVWEVSVLVSEYILASSLAGPLPKHRASNDIAAT